MVNDIPAKPPICWVSSCGCTVMYLFNFRVKPPFPRELTYISNFRAIGEEPGNDVIVRIILRYTVNANGETTADVFDYSASCGSGG